MRRWGIVNAVILGLSLELFCGLSTQIGLAQTTLPPTYPESLVTFSGDAFHGVIRIFEDSGFVLSHEDGADFLMKAGMGEDPSITVVVRINHNRCPQDMGYVDKPLSILYLLDGTETSAERYVEVKISQGTEIIDYRSTWIDFSNAVSVRDDLVNFLRQKGVQLNETSHGTQMLSDAYGWHASIREVLGQKQFLSSEDGSQWIEFIHSPDGMFKRSRSFKIRVRLIDYISDGSVVAEVQVLGAPRAYRMQQEARALFQIRDLKSRALFADLMGGLTQQTSARRTCLLMESLALGDYKRAMTAYDVAQEMGVSQSEQYFGRAVEDNFSVGRMKLTDLDEHQKELLSEHLSNRLRLHMEGGATIDWALADLEKTARRLRVEDVDLRSNFELKIQLSNLSRDFSYGYPTDWMPRFRDVFMKEAFRKAR